MSYLRVASAQAGTTAGVVVESVSRSGMCMIVVSDLSPGDLLLRLLSTCDRLEESVTLRPGLYSFDISVLVVYWAVLERPGGSVGAFVPTRFTPGQGSKDYMERFIDPLMALNSEGTRVDSYFRDEPQPFIVEALNSSWEVDPIRTS